MLWAYFSSRESLNMVRLHNAKNQDNLKPNIKTKILQHTSSISKHMLCFS